MFQKAVRAVRIGVFEAKSVNIELSAGTLGTALKKQYNLTYKISVEGIVQYQYF